MDHSAIPSTRRLMRAAAGACVAVGCAAAVIALSATPVRAAEAVGAPRADAGSSRYVLVYSGPADCDGCASAIGAVVKASGVPLRYVAQPAAVAALLPGALAFVVPGTNDNIEPMRRTFNRVVRAPLRAYLLGGGRYWGLCGGAFLAVQHYWLTATELVPALGIVPANADTYANDNNAHLEKVRWYGRFRWMYYEGGPYFILNGSRPGITVLATYADGSIAALAYRHGRGKVIVSGVHPEATRDWLIEDGIDSSAWTPTFPLAVAMLKSLLS